MVDRDNRRVCVTVLGEPGKAWPSSLWEGLGKHSGEGGLGYQLSRRSKTNWGTRAGASSQPGTGSVTWSQRGHWHASARAPPQRARRGPCTAQPRALPYWPSMRWRKPLSVVESAVLPARPGARPHAEISGAPRHPSCGCSRALTLCQHINRRSARLATGKVCTTATFPSFAPLARRKTYRLHCATMRYAARIR